MGERYTTTPISGYNSSAPVDDGTQSEANKVKWATHKDKLGDPLKNQVASIDAKLLAMADVGPDAKATTYTTVSSDHQKTLEISTAFVTITLLAASSAPEGYTLTVKNNSGGAIYVDGTASEEIDGSATPVTLTPNQSSTYQLNQAGTGYISLGQTSEAINAVVESSGVTESLVKLIHPDQSKGLQELQRQGVYPASFQQQWGGMGFGGLPDGALGEVATCNVSNDATSTTINATNVDCAFKVGKTTTIKSVFIKIYKTANLTGNTTVTINGQAETIPEKTITNNADGEWVRVDFTTPPTATEDTAYNINVATTGNAIQWMDGNGNYPHGGNNQFIIVAADAQNILQSGLSGFDGALHCYEGAPLDQSGAFYFANTELNHKRGLIHLAGTGFTKDKTIYDSGLGADNNRIVIRTNVTTGFAQVDLYENDENKLTVTGTTDISTGNHIVSAGYRAEGDGSDFLKLYIDGASEGAELTSQTITLDRSFEDGHSAIGGGFGLAPAWTDNEDMSVLPSASGWTWSGTATEANAMVVDGGILYQNGAGYASTDPGYYEKTTTLDNAVGWAVESKIQHSEGSDSTSGISLSIYVQDGTKEVYITMNSYYLNVHSGQAYVQYDFTKETTIKIIGKGSDYYIYMDGKLLVDGTGLLTNTTATNGILFGDISTSAGNNSTAQWSYLKYYEGAYLPEYSDVQISEFAQWNDDKSSLLSTIYNAGSIQSVKTLAGMNENYVKTVKQVISVNGIISQPTCSTTDIPMEDMGAFAFGNVLATCTASVANNTATRYVFTQARVSGINLDYNESMQQSSIAAAVNTITASVNHKGAGLKYVDVIWRANVGVGSVNGVKRTLEVEAE